MRDTGSCAAAVSSSIDQLACTQNKLYKRNLAQGLVST